MSNTKTVSNSYALAFLATHPATKDIVHRHLGSMIIDEKQLLSVNGTLSDMFERNMGGGIPYNTITALMGELDNLHCPLQATDS